MDLSGLMRQAQEMAGQLKRTQDSLREKVVEGTAGGGMVRARMNGNNELIGLEIEKDVVDPADPELLADLVMAAVNAARAKVEQERLSSLQQLTGGLDLSALGFDPSKLG